jgi:hypothetical protein
MRLKSLSAFETYLQTLRKRFYVVVVVVGGGGSRWGRALMWERGTCLWIYVCNDDCLSNGPLSHTCPRPRVNGPCGNVCIHGCLWKLVKASFVMVRLVCSVCMSSMEVKTAGLPALYFAWNSIYFPCAAARSLPVTGGAAVAITGVCSESCQTAPFRPWSTCMHAVKPSIR